MIIRSTRYSQLINSTENCIDSIECNRLTCSYSLYVNSTPWVLGCLAVQLLASRLEVSGKLPSSY